MDKTKIRKIALQNGFQLKEQDDGSMDLHPYVYQFAAKLLLESIQTRLRMEEKPKHAHNDDVAVDVFALAMKTKMALGRALGRSGWDDPAKCSVERLQYMLAACVSKGDPVDVGNLAMMLYHRGGSTAPQVRYEAPRLVSYAPNMQRCTVAVGDEKYHYQRECKNLPWGEDHD